MTKSRTRGAKDVRPGFDGAEEYIVPVKLTMTREEPRIVRARPGTFEWRYHRKDETLTALYHAGVKYADLWERAGAADAKSPDLQAIGGAGWRGLPDSRVAALDELKEIMRELGKLTSSRLSTYCVRGHSVSQMAAAHGVPARDMAAVLHMDLRALAYQLHYL